MKHRSAFSLMEILVCIGIILILIALIFPILTGAKLRAKETIYIANLRQIYSAALMYRADFDANPPNNLTFPAWRPYLPMSIACGCPLTPPTVDLANFGAYSGRFISPLVAMDAPEMKACAEKRQGDWPVLVDMNHMRTTVARETGRRALILCRENGSIVVKARVDIGHFLENRTTYPCPELDDPFQNQ